MPRIAVAQVAPVFLDRAATLDRAVGAVAEAATAGAQLVLLPETFVPGYPAWAWRLRPGTDMGLSERLHARLREEAVDLARDDLKPLRDAARQHGITVVCGVHEVGSEAGGGTLYNSVVTIGPDGTLLNRHRKLMPTNPERMVWGQGDASGLKVVDTPVGRVGALICWESYMPLVRCALYAQGLDLYATPTYDSAERSAPTMQHIAREAGCWVACCGCSFRGCDVPASLPGRAQLFPEGEDEWINPGDSVIVAPGGKIVAGPLHEAHGLLTADIDLGKVDAARRNLDVVGHYARPDLFRLQVDTRPHPPVEFER